MEGEKETGANKPIDFDQQKHSMVEH